MLGKIKHNGLENAAARCVSETLGNAQDFVFWRDLFVL